RPVPVALAVQLARLAQGKACPGRRRVEAGVLAGQEAARQRVVRDHADALVAAQGQKLRLDVAEEEVVARLDAVEPGQAEPGADPPPQRRLPGGGVRAADVAPLARADEVVDRS